MAEWRARQPQQQIEHGERDYRNDDVIVERVIEVVRPDAAALQAAEAILAAGQFGPAERGGVSQRRQRQRQQRKIHAAPPQDDDAYEGCCRRDHDHRQQQRQPDLAAEPVELDQPRRIGADAEPGAVAERHQPGIADAEIEPHRRDGQRHHHGAGVVGQPKRVQAERQRDHRERRQQQRPVFCRRRYRHSNFSIRSPSKPRGRTSSTRNIKT